MKKVIKKLFVCTLFIILLSGCGKSYIINTSLDEVITKVNNKESFILYIGSAKCSHCATYKPKLEKVVNKHKIKVYYVDVSKLDDKELNKLSDIVSYSGTPNTAFIVKGEDPGSQTHIDGDVSESYIEDALKDNGYLK